MASPTHTGVAATSLGQFDAIQIPTESPGPDEVLVKVAYSSMIAFDTYVTDRGAYVEKYPVVLGFSAGGTVVSIGNDVKDLEVGDNVAVFGFGASRNKTMQEFVVVSQTVVGKIPDNTISLAEAATIPDNFVTAFYTVFNQLGLPAPTSFPATTAPPLADTPILVYGAGSVAGIYTVQLLHLAGYKRVFATASKKHHEYLKSLGASDTFDYNSPTLVEEVAKAVGGDGNITYAVDCIATETTLKILEELVGNAKAKVAVLLPVKQGEKVTNGLDLAMYFGMDRDKYPFGEAVEVVEVRTFLYQQDEYLKQNLMPKILPELLKAGHIKPTRVRLLDQGTFKERVGTGLDLLRNNAVSGEKVVVKVSS